MIDNDLDYRNALLLAYNVARLSNDPSSQVAAVILPVGSYDVALHEHVADNNHFPVGIEQTSHRWASINKGPYVEHAERNAIYLCARRGISTHGATMVAPWASCVDCARAIIASGIATLVVHRQAMDRTPQRWAYSIAQADALLDEAGIHKIAVDAVLGSLPVRMDGKTWEP